MHPLAFSGSTNERSAANAAECTHGGLVAWLLAGLAGEVCAGRLSTVALGVHLHATAGAREQWGAALSWLRTHSAPEGCHHQPGLRAVRTAGC
eukprot:scaffold242520_cov36-Tisochrysis_lutea.AAC.4